MEKKYFMVNDWQDVMTDGYSTPDEVLEELEERGYTREEMRTAGFQLVLLLVEENGTWSECLEVVEY